MTEVDDEKVFPLRIHIPRANIVKSERPNTATLILFHGSGGNGEDFKQWLDILNRKELRFPHIKIIYPTAPIQTYTANGGLPSNIWFDRRNVSIDAPELKHSIDIMCNKASELIHREIAGGIPPSRIIIGGFSMGGCLALHLAYRFKRGLGGCVAISSFLSEKSLVYESLKFDSSTKYPELLMLHGIEDNVVPLQWGESTFNKLQTLGVKGRMLAINSASHDIDETNLKYFKSWVKDKLR
ncbi:lysophospholipase-like protein 1 [Trichogramma pretiosum]|uniref:lysophospholipase-like protein 1 n=1 Tax=Trichogramma pretiosum TaxID=7493 RepID=UPI0006C9646A|nr:lysophospholipase-like protein 1 [Trichogramma pretiosum]XP_014220503.1 lysophospholipase-like protein 1 [Trichogramma pretiosum]XP_014220504.1 lysophospholipase-like protein 1 [Trichogramma pretiosum]XP_023317819.1 lysophospholipase-like protein 1 [Trichogramma pretiosum]